MSKLHEKPVLHGRDHLADHPDPIPGLPGPSGRDLDDLILSTDPDAFWKLNELSGLTAHDSSGNSHDLTATTAAIWGGAAGPPGDPTASFFTSSDDRRIAGPLTAFTDDFTAGVWVNTHTAVGLNNSEFLGQGYGRHANPGWGLYAVAGTGFAVMANGHLIGADNPFTVDTWYLLAVVRDSGTWKLYVDGLLQAATMTDAPGSGYGGNTWIGNDGYSGHTIYSHDSLLSYAFITDSVLHSTDLLALLDAALNPGGGADSQVLLSDGAGGSHWGKVTGAAIEDGTIADADVAAAADIQPTKLQHPGGTTTFLRADGTWAAPAGGGGAPSADTQVWMPLTTVVSSVPELVWDASNSLIPTLTPI